MRFVLMHRSIVEQDAIGADISGMYDLLSASHECCLYGEYVEVPGRNRLSRGEIRSFLADPENTAIYHHSAHWTEGEELLQSAAGRIVFKYHNVTPPDFFFDFEPYWESCLLGREQTYRLVHRFRDALWLSASLHNLAELGIQVLRHRAVVPPFLSTVATRRACPNAALLKQLVESAAAHVLLVGRFVPNKGHHLFVRILQEYKNRYGEEIVGIVAGKLDPVCQDYYDAVIAAASEAGVAGNLRYVGCVPDADLLSYYLGCDAYLCCSDHEGFCVPAVESQSAWLPVIAKCTGALEETLGPGQILLGDNPADYADALYRLRSDEAYWRAIVERGAANAADRFNAGRIAADLTAALEDYLGVLI